MALDYERQKATGCEIVAWISAGAAMILILKLHLLPALFAGLLVYELVHIMSRPLRLGKLRGQRARIIVITLLATVIVSLLSLIIWGAIAFFHGGSENIPALMKKMAEIVEEYRESLPVWLKGYLPGDPGELREGFVQWLQAHAQEVQTVGREAGELAVHVVIGMVLGALISLTEVDAADDYRPLAGALVTRAKKFSQAFRSVVFAQMRIAALNALFAAIYLGILLPLFGVHLPLVKVLVAITFITGLLPVVGNIISNTAIVIVSLSDSLSVAGASLVFLVVIHKMEYFLNARIIGSRIHAHAWELLIAMILMEAAFGLAGVIAAPIYYAYIKSELTARELI
ncbi:MAG: AI-2E family transporter [Dissulfurispiraceae bacterium]|jgi:predicted PurR-regulated permease PerM